MDTLAKDISFKSLLEKAGDYVETKVELVKLKAVDKSSNVISSIASVLVIATVALVFFVIVNIGIALWIGDLMGKSYLGFFIVAGFYALTGLVCFLFRDQWFKRPVGNALIKKFLN